MQVSIHNLKGPLNKVTNTYWLLLMCMSLYITKSLPARFKCVSYIFYNISFIFLYCTKPRLLKNPQIIPCAFCNVIEGKNKHNNTQHYALTITRSLANKSITDLIQYHLAQLFKLYKWVLCQKCFRIALNRKVVRKAYEAFVSKCT